MTKTNHFSTAIISRSIDMKRTSKRRAPKVSRKNGTIKVLVTDDHAISRAGLAGVLQSEPDISVVGEAVDGQDAIKKAIILKPDIVIMDILMPQMDGLTAGKEIKQRLPNTKIIMLTISEREDHLFQALRFGAQGYLSKDAAINEIVDAVRRVNEGITMISPPLVSKLAAELRDVREEPSISKREMQVLQMLGEGLSNEEMAQQLYISESTIRTYIHRIMEKLRLKNRSEAVVYAINNHFTNTLGFAE